MTIWNEDHIIITYDYLRQNVPVMNYMNEKKNIFKAFLIF
jgi:hypothetical protein